MTTGPTYYSDEELVKRLQELTRLQMQGGARRRGGGVREIRDLAATLAGRIYDEPQKWGIANIQREFRDDAAADTLLKLLSGTAEITGRTRVSEWFSRSVEARFRELWTFAEKAREKYKEERASDEEGEGSLTEEESESAAGVLEENSDMWKRFEAEFPSDAFILRLRYVMNRRPEDIAVMLDQGVQSVTTRIDRGRDRFRMLCEQGGFSRRQVAAIMARMSEEREQ